MLDNILSKLFFTYACNKNLQTEIEGWRHLGSEIGYFQFSSQVGLDFLKNKTGLGYIGLPPWETVVMMSNDSGESSCGWRP